MIIMSVFIPVNSWAADSIRVIVDGNEIEFSNASVYIDAYGRTQVPSRFIGEALGAKVEWDEIAERVTFYRIDSNSARIYLEFQIGSSVYYSGKDKGQRDETHTMDTQVILENNRAYIPLRYVAEALGATVDWNAADKIVTVTSGQRMIKNFVISDSFTEKVYDTDDGNVKAVLFTINHLVNLEDRLENTLEVVAQRIGPESIDRIRTWVLANRLHEAKDENDNLRETFLDPVSGQYVRIVRFANIFKDQGSFRIIVYDKGDVPV
jgi:hypothetical protein